MKIARFSLVVVLLATSSSCQRRVDYLVVHVYRNRVSPVGIDLDRRFNEFDAGNPRLASGKRIAVATYEASDYQQFLRDRIPELKPELIVLDSPQDIDVNPVVKQQATGYANVCAATRSCGTPVPAIIPSWVTGEELEATKRVLSALQGH